MSVERVEAWQNELSRRRGNAVFERYRHSLGLQRSESEQTDLEELILDLLHLCDLRGLRFADALVEAAAEKRRSVLAELEASLAGPTSDGGHQ